MQNRARSSRTAGVKTRTRNLIVLVALGTLGGLGAWLAGGPGARLGVLDAMPTDSFLVATLDLEAVRQSPLGSVLDEERGERLLGTGPLSQACGFSAFQRLREVGLAIPEEGDSGEFGLAARADVSRSELRVCGEKLREAGSKEGVAATFEQQGPFTVVAQTRTASGTPGAQGDRQATAESGGTPPAVAIHPSGLILLARGRWLSSMIDATRGGARSAAKHPVHARLRERLTKTASVARRALIATLVLPKELRERLKREMTAELDPNAPDTAETMRAVLGVGAAGLALAPGASGASSAKGQAGGPRDAELTAELECETEADCRSVEQLILRKRLGWSQNLALRLVGLGPIIDSLTTRVDGAQLSIQARAPADTLARLANEALEPKRGLPRIAPHIAPPRPPDPPAGERDAEDAKPIGP
jgi:hypothetical protein